MARTKNGLNFTRNLQELQKKKDSKKLQPHTNLFQKLKPNMKSGTASCLKILSREKFSSAKKKYAGYAVSADIFMKVKKHLRIARYVDIPKLTSKLKKQTIKTGYT